MSAILKITQHMEVTIRGITHSFGSLTVPVTKTLASDLPYVQSFSVAQNTTADVFDATTDLSAYDSFWVVSDQDAHLELVTDDGGEVGEESYTIKLLADVPQMIHSNVSYANYTVDFAGGTLDVIETIRVRNLGATTANVDFAAYL